MLRQNRRVVSGGDGEEDRSEELESFHRVLTDISWGRSSQEVRAFIVNAYVRGAKINCAENTGFESNTAVFTKRRYRSTESKGAVFKGRVFGDGRCRAQPVLCCLNSGCLFSE